MCGSERIETACTGRTDKEVTGLPLVVVGVVKLKLLLGHMLPSSFIFASCCSSGYTTRHEHYNEHEHEHEH